MAIIWVVARDAERLPCESARHRRAAPARAVGTRRLSSSSRLTVFFFSINPGAIANGFPLTSSPHLSTLSSDAVLPLHRWSLHHLLLRITAVGVANNQTFSNWEQAPLSSAQVAYAGLDALVALAAFGPLDDLVSFNANPLSQHTWVALPGRGGDDGDGDGDDDEDGDGDGDGGAGDGGQKKKAKGKRMKAPLGAVVHTWAAGRTRDGILFNKGTKKLANKIGKKAAAGCFCYLPHLSNTDAVSSLLKAASSSGCVAADSDDSTSSTAYGHVWWYQQDLVWTSAKCLIVGPSPKQTGHDTDADADDGAEGSITRGICVAHAIAWIRKSKALMSKGATLDKKVC